MFVPTAVALAAAFWTIVLVALAVEKHVFDQALRLWKSLSKFNKCVVAVILFGVVAFAGTKPLSGGGDGGDDSTGTNVVEVVEGGASTNLVEDVASLGEDGTEVKVRGEGEQWNLSTCFADQQKKESNILCSSSPFTFTSTLPAPLSLGAVGRGESFDFSAPEGAVVATNWLMHGATTGRLRVSPSDWDFPFGTNVVRSFAAFADGRLEPWPGGDDVTLAPLVAPLGIVPAANWSLLAPTNRPSLFWWAMRGNALVCTWQNVLLGRETDCPVSFQAELRATGGVTYRYDLGRLASDDPLTNAVVLARSGLGITRGEAELAKQVARGVTASPFSDSPLSRDLTSIVFRSTEEVACDEFAASFAAVMGDLDPFACPPNSTNTVLEHAYYSGTTNGAIHLPESSPALAVLRVSVGGTGSGVLLVGGRAVPLRAPPSFLTSNSSCLTLTVPRGETLPVYLRGDATLSLSLDSDDFAFGVLPDLTGRHCRGWINFPFTEASHPCIHSFMAHETDVTLPVGEGADDLACAWNETDDVEVWNRPPRSARISGRFDPRQERPVTYTLSHPLYLFGRTEYEQNVRYCPKPSDDDPTDYYDEEVLYPDECWCCHWQTCDTNCTCGCSLCGDWTDALTNDCELASTNYPHMQGVLKIRTPRAYSASVALPVPAGVRNCCPCPEHHTNGVSLVYARRVSVVDPTGSAFRSSDKPVTVRVAATEPSYEPGDGRALFATNGVPMESNDYTCLGVGVSAYGVDLAALNAKNRQFGLPVVVNTNLDEAVLIRLDVNVLLRGGRIRLSVEDATAPLEVWGYDSARGRMAKFADADTSLDVTMAEWRRMTGHADDGSVPSVNVRLLVPRVGKATIVLHYWNVIDGKFVEDEARQAVTAINPPLLPDYNRDGAINEDDVARSLDKTFYFWTNRDVWKNDDAFDLSFWDYIRGLVYATNGDDDKVNGRNDLVNLLPLAIDVHDCLSGWGAANLHVVIRTVRRSITSVRRCYADMPWNEARNGVLTDVQSDDESSWWEILYDPTLKSAKLRTLNQTGDDLAQDVIGRCANGRGVVFLESNQTASSPVEIVVKYGDAVILTYRPKIRFSDIDSMYRWHNIRGGSAPAEVASPTGWPDSERDNSNLFFVHGYNINVTEAREWGRAVFKRLWWAGLNARYHVVAWDGSDGQMWLPTQGLITPDYQRNVEKAFNSSSNLAFVVNASSGRNYLLAHSLGNMIVSAAIQDWGLNCDKYLMLNAAVPIEAYDAVDGSTDETIMRMTPRDWLSYTNRLTASRWHELFEAQDARRCLTWKGRFAAVRNLINYFSAEEEVLANGDGTEASLGREFAWYYQETHKGRKPHIPIYSTGRNEGGWAFNPLYDNRVPYFDDNGLQQYRTEHMLPDVAAEISEANLRRNPFFGPFEDASMCAYSNGTYTAMGYAYRAQLLADAIPALSFAAGRNPIPRVEQESGDEPQIGHLSQNVDMVDLKDMRMIDVLSSDPDADERRWNHTFFISKPYSIVHALFENIVERTKPAGGNQ